MTTALDVAAYILKSHGRMSTMKLQKLVYYSQAWSLAWGDCPLFDEDFEAWANGPVLRTLFRTHRGRFNISFGEVPGDPSVLSDRQQEGISIVLADYGKLTGAQLSDLSHSDRPWREARGGLSPGARSSAKIEKDTMEDFYGGLWLSMNG